MVVKYLNQNYSKLKRDHQHRGELFTDPEFPPTNASLFVSGKSDEEIVWKRPGVSHVQVPHGYNIHVVHKARPISGSV